MWRILGGLTLLLSTTAWAGGGATAELQLGYTLAHQRAQLAEAAVEDLDAKLVEIEAFLRSQGMGSGEEGRSLADVLAGLDTVRAQVEEIEFLVKGVRADLDQYMADQERRQLHDEARLAQLESLLAVRPPPAPSLDGSGEPTGTAAEDPAPAAEELPVDAAGRLALAMSRIEQGQQAAARAILEQAAAEATGDPLLPELLYRAAETWLNEGKFKQAARAFQVVTDEHARSSWAPWAMFKIGVCFDEMGRADAAKTFYEGVQRNYPQSEAAAEAKGRLSR
jgi:TolA-binding protein